MNTLGFDGFDGCVFVCICVYVSDRGFCTLYVVVRCVCGGVWEREGERRRGEEGGKEGKREEL